MIKTKDKRRKDFIGHKISSLAKDPDYNGKHKVIGTRRRYPRRTKGTKNYTE